MDVLTLSLALLLISVVFLWCLLTGTGQGKQLPPGPRGLPIIGCLLDIDKRQPYRTFTAWGKAFGDVISFPLLHERLVMLNSYTAIKEAFVRHGDVFSGRPLIHYIRDNLVRNSGIVLIDGRKWHDNRKFSIHVLREFGVGRSLSEDILTDEMQVLKQQLDDRVGTAVDVMPQLCRTINNVVSRLSFGRECDNEDPAFQEVLRSIQVLTSESNVFSQLPSLFPSLLKLPQSFLYMIERLTPFRAAFQQSVGFMQRKIDEHRKSLGQDADTMDISQARDVCETLIIHKARCDRESNKEHDFTDFDITQILLELFTAGTETTSSTLTFAFFFMACHPDIQSEVQAEIDDKIGSDRHPKMKDRVDTHFVNAVLDEASRLATVAPFSIPHRSTQDAQLMGFFIPKNSIIISNIYAVHHDPQLWEKPYEFHPWHFLTQDGVYKASEHLIPFSVGRRSCMGEMLAKMELFLIFAGVMQAYRVRLADPNVDTKAVEIGITGVTRRPLPHCLILTKRHGQSCQEGEGLQRID